MQILLKDFFLFKIYLLYLFFLPFFLMRKRNHSPLIENILVIRVDRFGDMVLTLPLLHAIRKRYPSAKLSVLCSPQGKPLLESQNSKEVVPFVDEIIVWDDVWDMHREPMLGVPHLWAILKMGKFLRQKKFDTVLQPMTPGVWSIVALSTVAKRTIVTVDENILLPRLLKKHIDFPCVIPKGERRHRFELCSMCASKIDIKTMDRMNLHFENENSSVTGMNVFYSKCVVVNVSAGDPVRQLPLDIASSLIEKLLSSFKEFNVLLVGTNNDIKYAAELCEKFPDKIENLVGTTSVDDLIYIFKSAPILITSDTGSMHLAAMTDIHIVAYFTAGSLCHFRPMTDNCTIIQHELGCSGCGDMCFTSEFPKPCMAAITADELFDAVSVVLNKQSVSFVPA